MSRPRPRLPALAALLALAGCAAAGPVPPPDRGPLRAWPAAGPARAVVVAVHGFNDYGNAFALLGPWLAARGVALRSYDQPGFGASAGRGRWFGSAALVAALREAIAAARAAEPGVPLFVLGESMGAAVAVVTLADPAAPPVDGVILSAPAVWGGAALNPLYRALLRALVEVTPGQVLTGRDLGVLASDNLEMLRGLGRDPLVVKGTRADALAGLVQLMGEARAAAPRLGTRTLVLAGAKDQVVPPAARASFARTLGTADCTAAVYPAGWHMVLRDLGRATAWADLLAWLEGRALPSGQARGCAGGPPPPPPPRDMGWPGASRVVAHAPHPAASGDLPLAVDP